VSRDKIQVDYAGLVLAEVECRVTGVRLEGVGSLGQCRGAGSGEGSGTSASQHPLHCASDPSAMQRVLSCHPPGWGGGALVHRQVTSTYYPPRRPGSPNCLAQPDLARGGRYFPVNKPGKYYQTIDWLVCLQHRALVFRHLPNACHSTVSRTASKR